MFCLFGVFVSIFKSSVELFALPHSQWSSICPFPGPLLFSVIQTNPIVFRDGFRDELLFKVEGNKAIHSMIQYTLLL